MRVTRARGGVDRVHVCARVRTWGGDLRVRVVNMFIVYKEKGGGLQGVNVIVVVLVKKLVRVKYLTCSVFYFSCGLGAPGGCAPGKTAFLVKTFEGWRIFN